jgi:spore germination protein GerM
MERLRAVLVVLLLGACGVSAESEPHPMADAALPVDRPSSATTAPSGAGRVFFIRVDRVVEVTSFDPVEVSAEEAILLLLAGPSEVDVAAGIRSAIPDGTTLVDLSVQNGVATIDLSEAFFSVSGQEQTLATAQVVLTVTTVPEITRVRFEVDGEPIDVPRADGTLAPGSVTAADYAELR